jgi:hypothetical protein
MLGIPAIAPRTRGHGPAVDEDRLFVAGRGASWAYRIRGS